MQIKIVPSILMLLSYVFIYSQEPTEIYLFELNEQESGITLSNPINISNRPGYDNQPSFTEDGTGILFTSFRDGQADISKYFIADQYRVWITNTEFNEFSPMPFPGKKKYFSCVRMKEDGIQNLYKYAYKKRAPEPLIPDVTIGYYMWYTEKSVISFVIGDIESLQVSNFKYDIRYPIQYNIGRSISHIPAKAELGSDLISYISMSHEEPEIYSINPLNSESKYIADVISGSQDLAWTKNGCMLMGIGNKIFKYHPVKDKQWTAVEINCDLPFDGVSRLVVSPDGSHLAVVISE